MLLVIGLGLLFWAHYVWRAIPRHVRKTFRILAQAGFPTEAGSSAWYKRFQRIASTLFLVMAGASLLVIGLLSLTGLGITD